MRILLTGGTGLIGRALCRYWQGQGHSLVVWSRQPERVAAQCGNARRIARLDELRADEPFDAVVNLAGAPIADRPWTARRRDVLWQSRVDLTRELVEWMNRQTAPPPVLLSASAVGWYGDRGEEALDEASPQGVHDFASRLCKAWEQEANRATQHGVRVAVLRIAPVLAAEGGMLARLRLPFRLGLGGRLGSGRQWMPWIHLDDLVPLFDHLLTHPACNGPFNACAPGMVRSLDFTKALAAALHRPALLPAPAWALRLGLGEMSILLLGGQCLTPRRTAEAGFAWRHPQLAPALQQLMSAA